MISVLPSFSVVLNPQKGGKHFLRNVLHWNKQVVSQGHKDKVKWLEPKFAIIKCKSLKT